jgi:transposase
VIRRQFGVRYTIANVWNLMQSLGWSCQKPDGSDPGTQGEGSPVLATACVAQDKKNRSTWSPFGVP